MTKLKTKVSESAFLADLDKPSLHALSYALRHPDTWPEGFSWNYTNCGHCAMGLAHKLWSRVPRPYADDGTSIMARAFAMPYTEAKKVFFDANCLWGWGKLPYKPMSAVTPENVADAIDRYIARAE